MRIAQVAPLYESVPPLQYGGTERVVSHLTEELVRLGHEVTLFASGDSETSARLIPACERSLWNDPKCRDYMAHHIRLIGLVFEDVSRFDIIHFHADYLHYPLLNANWQATVYHGLPSGLYRFNEGGDYLAFIGTVSTEKRIDRAIEIAGR